MAKHGIKMSKQDIKQYLLGGDSIGNTLRILYKASPLVQKIISELSEAISNNDVNLSYEEGSSISARFLGIHDVFYGCMSKEEKVQMERDITSGLEKIRAYVQSKKYVLESPETERQ